MKKEVNCALCGGKAHLMEEVRIIRYKKEEVEVPILYYKCEKCMEEYTTTETDTISLRRVYIQYNHKKMATKNGEAQTEISIEGVVTLMDINGEQFRDLFIAWLEEKGWSFGGAINELDEDGNIKR